MNLTELTITEDKALEKPIPFYIYYLAILPTVGLITAIFAKKTRKNFVRWLFDTILYSKVLIFHYFVLQ